MLENSILGDLKIKNEKLLSNVYGDYMSKVDIDIADRTKIMENLSHIVTDIADFDDFTEQAQYAIAMRILDHLACDEPEDLSDFLSLDTQTKYLTSLDYQWEPEEFVDLGELLGYVTQCAFEVYTGAGDIDAEEVTQVVHSIKSSFDTLWGNALTLQGPYGNHLYLTELLTKYEHDFYLDLDVIQGVETVELSPALMAILGRWYEDNDGEECDCLEDDSWNTMSVEEIIEHFTGKNLAGTLAKEGYAIEDANESELTICVVEGVNSHGLLN